MTAAERASDPWERWAWAWHSGLLLALAAAAGSSVMANDWIAVCAAIALAGWYWAGRKVGRKTVFRTCIYLWLILVVSLAFSWRMPTFLAAAGFLTGHLFALLPFRIAIVSAVAATGTVSILLYGQFGVPGAAAATCAMATSMLLAGYIESIARQSGQRLELIAELEATRRTLAIREREAGTRNERQRLARDIHDTVTQDLISAVRLIESSRLALADGAPAPLSEILSQLELAERAAREGLAESRRLVWASAASINDAGLPLALERVCSRFRGESGVRVELVLASELDPIPTTMEVALLRVTQEALANVQKYAKANHVVVTLTNIGNQLALDIQDDGVGFDPIEVDPEVGVRGFGLSGIRERIDTLGGQVFVDSAVGEGTTIAVQVPLHGNVG